MHDQDSVDPGDAALQELLTLVAEQIGDPDKKVAVLDFLISMPPLAEWSTDERGMLRGTCGYIISLARMSRELDGLHGRETHDNVRRFRPDDG
jgi:hypothetical protein